MRNIKSKNIIITLFSTLLIITLLIISFYFIKNKTSDNNINLVKYVPSKVKIINELEERDFYKIEYNRIDTNINNINSIVNDYINTYIFSFKEKSKINIDKQNNLKIDITFYNGEGFLNVVLKIYNSFYSKPQIKSFIIDTKECKVISISKIKDPIVLKEKILDIAKKKYSTYIYSLVKDFNIEDAEYIFDDSSVQVFFTKPDFLDISYIPSVVIYNEEKTVSVINSYDKSKKFIAFSFDDGPSVYTKCIVDLLNYNSSHATFFMLGSKMKSQNEFVKYVFDSGNEIGSHTYSHKNLPNLTLNDMLNEINSTNIVYNDITNDNIKLIRPPYGNINKLLKNNSPLPLITWSIDTNDWLYRDSLKVYNHILDRAFDGAIVLMHDIYPTSEEAVKMVVPELIARGYNIVSVSELASIKGYTLDKGIVYDRFK